MHSSSVYVSALSSWRAGNHNRRHLVVVKVTTKSFVTNYYYLKTFYTCYCCSISFHCVSFLFYRILSLFVCVKITELEITRRRRRGMGNVKVLAGKRKKEKGIRATKKRETTRLRTLEVGCRRKLFK